MVEEGAALVGVVLVMTAALVAVARRPPIQLLPMLSDHVVNSQTHTNGRSQVTVATEINISNKLNKSAAVADGRRTRSLSLRALSN